MILKLKFLLISLAVFLGLVWIFILRPNFWTPPIDPFYLRYQEASDVVLGTLISVEPSNESIAEFSDYPSGIKRCVFKIERSWKGQRSGEIECFAVSFDYRSHRYQWNQLVDKVNFWKVLSPLSPGAKYLVFIRKGVQGKKLVANQFGITPAGGGDIEKDSEYAPLEALKSGKPMSEAIKLASWGAQQQYKRYLEEKTNLPVASPPQKKEEPQ